MSRNKNYKRGKRGAGKHVQLSERLMSSLAWKSLKPGPRALYVELKRRYNGRNNGEIYLSHRDAAALLNMHPNSMGSYFAELEEKGFIRLVRSYHLGSDGFGKANVWALEEEPTVDGRPAGMAFMRWKPA